MAPVDKPAIKIANKIHDLFTPGTGVPWWWGSAPGWHW